MCPKVIGMGYDMTQYGVLEGWGGGRMTKNKKVLLSCVAKA